MFVVYTTSTRQTQAITDHYSNKSTHINASPSTATARGPPSKHNINPYIEGAVAPTDTAMAPTGPETILPINTAAEPPIESTAGPIPVPLIEFPAGLHPYHHHQCKLQHQHPYLE